MSTTTTTTPSTDSSTSDTTDQKLNSSVYNLVYVGPLEKPPVRPFSWEDPGYGAQEFIHHCEAAMHSIPIVTDTGKIAFVCSRLQPDSRATRLMNSTAFSCREIQMDYAIFKAKFLLVFAGINTTLGKQIVHVVNSLQSPSSTSLWEALVDASNLSSGCVDTLKVTKWIEGEWMHVDSFQNFLQFFFYMSRVPEQTRRAALTLSFNPNDTLADFVKELEAKIQQKTNNHTLEELLTSQAVISDPRAPERQNPQNHLTVPATGPSYSCRSGHTEEKCYRKDQYNHKSSFSDDVQKKTDQDRGATRLNRPMAPFLQPRKDERKSGLISSSISERPQRARSPDIAPQTSQSRFCYIHGAGSHRSEDCFMILKLRHGYKNKPRVPGEASYRPARKPE